MYAEREPLREEVLDLTEGEKSSVLKRKKLGDKILKQIVEFVETFINGKAICFEYNNRYILQYCF